MPGRPPRRLAGWKAAGRQARRWSCYRSQEPQFGVDDVRRHRGDQVPHLAVQRHERTAATCLQQDVDEWLASGSTTRSNVRNFFAWAKKARLNVSVRITYQQPLPGRALTQEQRLASTKELLSPKFPLLGTVD